ncbi:MAG: ECF-type sigma factor [Proteobacteria bacterium]|nr:ECF-type sigma factor [Pseudomonadota bacterium]
MCTQSDYREVVGGSSAETGVFDHHDLFALFYTELKRRARGQLRRLPLGQTLQSTDLVHEAFARLEEKGVPACEGRSQFLAIVVTTMRDVLVDAIRRNSAAKRGGGRRRVTLNDEQEDSTSTEDVVTLAAALHKLGQKLPEEAFIACLRWLAGYTMSEIAIQTGVRKRTVERRLRCARAWLQDELKEE